MKKYFLLLAFGFFSQFVFCQPTIGKFFSATLKPGSQLNSVYIVVKSNVTLTGVSFSTFEFELGIPTSSVGTRPGFTVTSFDPTVTYATDGAIETQDGNTYYGYGFSGNGSANGSTTFTKDVEYTMAEVFFTGAPSVTSQVRMMQLPNGGTGTGNVYFYVADHGFDVTNTDAQFYGGSGTTVSNDGNGYNGSSYVYINIVLPIKLSSFNVTSKNNDALLGWSVENQDATSSHFEIERSTNGTDFNSIGTVNANAESKATYSYSDKNVNLSGTVYYRLKMVDKDGQFVYSDVRSVQFQNAGFAVTVYPNPVQNITKLNITLTQAQVIKVSINDALGSRIKQMEIAGQQGMNEKAIDLSTVPKGSYMIRIQAGQNLQTLPIIKN